MNLTEIKRKIVSTHIPLEDNIKEYINAQLEDSINDILYLLDCKLQEIENKLKNVKKIMLS